MSAGDVRAEGRPALAPGALLLVLSCVLSMTCAACAPPEHSTAPVAPGDPPARHAPSQPSAASLRTTSDRAALRNVELVVASWEHGRDGLLLAVRIENHGAGIGLASTPPAAGTHVRDAGGGRAPLLDDGADLDALAAAGLEPGAALAGTLRFPTPRGPEPWTLVVPPFAPLTLTSFAGSPRPASRVATAPAETPALATREAPPPPSPGSATDEVRSALVELLERQARALLRKDEGAYLETVHEQIRGNERRYFQHSRMVPFSEIGLVAPPHPLPVSTSRDVEIPVDLTFRLAEQPEDNPFVNRLTYRFKFDEGRWLVAAIHDEPQRPLFWRQRGLALHRTHHFLVYAWPQPAYDVLDVARDAESAYVTILQRGLPLATRYVVHLVTDERLFRRIVGSPLAVGAAASRQSMAADGTVRVDSRSFLLNGPLLAPYRVDHPDEEERRITIAHELVHLALSRFTRPATPPWLVEGAAVYYSGRLDFDSNRILVRSGLEGLSLPRLTVAAELGEEGGSGPGHGARAAFEYLYAGNLVEYLVRQFGNDRFLGFYRSYAELEGGTEVAPSAGRSLALTEQGLAAHFQLSLATLEQQVRESMLLRYR